MTTEVKPIPEGYHTLTPYLIVHDAAQAIEFYKRAFGAAELFRMAGPDGKVGHAEIKIGDSPVMLADKHPEMGARSPRSIGGSPVTLLVYVENVDGFFNQAVAARVRSAYNQSDRFPLAAPGRCRPHSSFREAQIPCLSETA